MTEEIIETLDWIREEVISARASAKEAKVRDFLLSKGWNGTDVEKAKEIADGYVCEEFSDGTITFREKTEEEIASEELKPCPFCGGKVYLRDCGMHLWQVQCPSCKIQQPVAFGGKETCIKAWNRRPSPVQKEGI